jgi:fumarate reductase subunit D
MAYFWMVAIMKKRSNAPILWVMFGGGGVLAALLGFALVTTTGIFVPMGWVFSPDALSYAKVLGLAQSWLGKLFLFVIVWLFSWHAAHRVYHSLHDFGVPKGWGGRMVSYVVAFVCTVLAAVSLLSI